MMEIPEFLREYFNRRDIKTDEEIKKFLYPKVDDLIDPYSIENIEKATYQIIKSIENKEKIFIYGDGDIDGIAGVFFILEFLKDKNVNFNYYLTHRLEDYEIEEEFADYLLKERYKIVILIDSGISSYKFLKKCEETNIKVIIIDHHLADFNILSKSHIYIHPFLISNNIDFSAAGLSFKLFQSLISNYSSIHLSDYICIAGLAVLSENVELKNDNRIFVKEMVRNLKNSKIKGLNFLISKYLTDEFEIEDIKIKINPKLNSPGRFGNPDLSLNLLTEKEDREIEKLLKEIEILDRKRYKITQKIIENIERSNGWENRFIILDNFPESLCGIISSRFVEKINLPFLVMSKKGDIIKGSGRSPENFNLYEVMKEIKDKFLSFGGHKNAIGFKFRVEKRDEIEEYWRSIKVSGEKKLKNEYDAIFEIDQIKPNLLEYFDLLKPYGKGNEPPVFLSRNVLMKKINKGNEVKYWAKKGNSVFECKLSNPEIQEGIKNIFYTPKIEKIDGYYRIILEIKEIN